MPLSFPGGAASSVLPSAFPLLAPDGLVGAPSYSFSGEPGIGFYRNGANRLSVALLGIEAFSFRPGIFATTVASGSGANLRLTQNTVADWFIANTAITGTLQISAAGPKGIQLTQAGRLLLAQDSGGLQSVSGMFAGTGVPNNANGSDGDFYFRGDTPATATQRLYIKSAGAWVATAL